MAAMTVIDHTEIGAGGTGYWEETSIPTDGTYDHLLIKASLIGEKDVFYDSLALTVNGITSSVYSNTAMFANSSTVVATRESVRAQLVNGFWPGAFSNSSNTTNFGAMEIWIPHYTNSDNYKSFLCRSVTPNVSAASSEWMVGIMGGLYNQTTAISSIKIASNNGTDLGQYSTITLYGVKGV